MTSPPRPSIISIQRNIFVENGGTIDEDLFEVADGSRMDVAENLFHANEGPIVGTDPILGDPGFRDAEAFDYRLRPGSRALSEEGFAGAFGAQGEVPVAARWWEMLVKGPRAIPPGSFDADPLTLRRSR